MSLKEISIKAAKPKEKKYRLSDNSGLSIIVYPNGNKKWEFRYTFFNQRKVIGIGSYPMMSLLAARQKRDELRLMLEVGRDPKAQQERQEIEEKQTFSKIALKWCDSQLAWSEAYRVRVKSYLELHAFGFLGEKLISELTIQDLIVPIKRAQFSGKHEVATRLQQRIKAIMRYSVQQGLIIYNPAQDLTGVATKKKVVHRPALDIAQLPELIKKITQHATNHLIPLALQFTLLTFVRSSELRFARWNEFDFEKQVWTIPAEREVVNGVKYSQRGAKMKTPHLVPLSTQAIQVLNAVKKITGHSEWVFTLSALQDKPMSENTLNKALRKMDYDTKTEVCLHGFRTLACSSLVESGFWSTDVIERQMSHQERNSVRAAYIHKAQHLNERKRMMQWWGDYLSVIQGGFIPPYKFKPEQYQLLHQQISQQPERISSF